jgi:hypothetical protein
MLARKRLCILRYLIRAREPSTPLAQASHSVRPMCRELCRRTWLIAEGTVLSIALLTPNATSHAASQKDADALVQQLSGLPAAIQSSGFSQICNPAPAQCPPRPLPPGEAKRRNIYDQLFALRQDGVAALARALGSRDESLRSNAALALGVLGGGWWKSDGSKIDIRDALPALEIALQDPGSRTRAFAAQDICKLRCVCVSVTVATACPD